MADKAILFDTTKCIACRACQVACKQWNELKAEKTSNRGSYENPPDLSPQTWLKITFNETPRDGGVNWLFGRRACMHCTDAPCVKVCPPKALTHHELGFVVYNKELCTGCGYCADACPFDVPRLNGSRITGIAKMDKCVMCTTPGVNRIDNGYEPACVKTCPSQALVYGNRDSLVSDGKARVTRIVARGYSNASLYGENEVGGLHVLYVLDNSPEAYGLPAHPHVSELTTLWQDVVQPLGLTLGGIAIIGLAINYVIARANVVKEKEHAEGNR